MLQETLRFSNRVVAIRGKAVEGESFDTSPYATFWAEASQAVAMSRRGRVHLIKMVDLGVLRALHAESQGGPSAGKMPIAVTCQDYESLGGPMLRGIRKTQQGWIMGDNSIVKFFNSVPGPQEGVLVQPREVTLSEETRADMAALSNTMEVLAQRAAAGKDR
jgi:hypothetical protein